MRAFAPRKRSVTEAVCHGSVIAIDPLDGVCRRPAFEKAELGPADQLRADAHPHADAVIEWAARSYLTIVRLDELVWDGGTRTCTGRMDP